jgi:uncharacterized protein (DUF2147 family)
VTIDWRYESAFSSTPLSASSCSVEHRSSCAAANDKEFSIFSLRHYARPLAVVSCFALSLSVWLQARDAHAAAVDQSKWPTEQLSGVWEQYDDDTKLLSSLVRIQRGADGRYEGLVEKVIPAPGDDANPICSKCTGPRKNQPVLGMRIITNLERVDIARFENGEILDPDSGDVYRLRITVIDAGSRLDVRGYLGFALFGRSQVWRRVVSPAR